jgi:BCS1 N terminal
VPPEAIRGSNSDPKCRYPAAKQQPAWGRSREFEITTRSVSRNQLNQSTTGDLDEEEMDEEDEHELEHGRRKRKVAFIPSPGEFNYESAWFNTSLSRFLR